MENESAREPAPIHGEKCFLNAIVQIVGERLIGFGHKFAQSSRFVREERIAGAIRVLIRRQNFSLTRKTLGAENRVLQRYVDTVTSPLSVGHHTYFAIAGSRWVPLSTCGRICVFL